MLDSKAIEPYQGDLDIGFEICRYCQAEVITSGSRWSTFYCDYCRPVVRAINALLDSSKLVSLPIGRHSLMHRWRHARPFTAMGIVSDWSESRLRSGWKSYSGGLDPVPWAGFGQYQGEVREREQPEAIQQVAAMVQDAKPDFLLGELEGRKRSGIQEGRV